MTDTSGGAFVGYRPQRATPANPEAAMRLAALLRGFTGEEQPEASVLDPNYQSAKQAGNIGRVAGLASDIPNPFSGTAVAMGSILPLIRGISPKVLLDKIPKVVQALRTAPDPAFNQMSKSDVRDDVWKAYGIDEVISPLKPVLPDDAGRFLHEVSDKDARFAVRNGRARMSDAAKLDMLAAQTPDFTPEQLDEVLARSLPKAGVYNLPELLAHRKLYEAAPDLRKMQVEIDTSNPKLTGEFKPDTGIIRLGPGALANLGAPEFDPLWSVLHEATHGKFSKAGLPHGTSSKAFARLNSNEAENVLRIVDALKKQGTPEADLVLKQLQSNQVLARSLSPYQLYRADVGEQYARKSWERRLGVTERPSKSIEQNDKTLGSPQHGATSLVKQLEQQVPNHLLDASDASNYANQILQFLRKERQL